MSTFKHTHIRWCVQHTLKWWCLEVHYFFRFLLFFWKKKKKKEKNERWIYIKIVNIHIDHFDKHIECFDKHIGFFDRHTGFAKFDKFIQSEGSKNNEIFLLEHAYLQDLHFTVTVFIQRLSSANQRPDRSICDQVLSLAYLTHLRGSAL